MNIHEEVFAKIPNDKEYVYLEAAKAVRRLAIVTGNRKYDKQAQRIIKDMKKELYKNEVIRN